MMETHFTDYRISGSLSPNPHLIPRYCLKCFFLLFYPLEYILKRLPEYTPREAKRSQLQNKGPEVTKGG